MCKRAYRIFMGTACFIDLEADARGYALPLCEVPHQSCQLCYGRITSLLSTSLSVHDFGRIIRQMLNTHKLNKSLHECIEAL